MKRVRVKDNGVVRGMENRGLGKSINGFRGKLGKRLDGMKRNVVAKVAGITAGMMAMVSSAYCSSASVDELGNKVIKMLFNILFLGGVVFLANGIRLFVSAIQQGEQAPPGAIGKAIASILSGIVMMAMKALLTSMGVNVDNWGLFS